MRFIGMALCAALPLQAAAQYPSKPITLVVPFTAGAANDVLARTLAAEMKDFGTVVVDNKPGANGEVAATFVKRAPADGHTLTTASASTIINTVISKLSYDILKDFDPVIHTNDLPFFLVVNQEALPVASARALVDAAKAKAGQLSYASAGNGSPHHFGMELLKLRTGIDVVHVPYKGMGQGVTDLLAGRVQMTITGYPAVAAHMKSGKLRVLAVAGRSRSATLPDVPTFAEAGIAGVQVDSWQGILVRAGTPSPIVGRLNAEFNRILKLPTVRERMATMAMEVVGGPPDAFAKVMRDDLQRVTEIAKAANIKGD
jgi:tripartite-type tricarboxylate transporter receptor subunit TctC